jgi:fatty acid desaturase
MTTTMTFDARGADAAGTLVRAAPDRVAEDKAMLRAAADLTRELNAPKPLIYWTDMLLSVAIGYGALVAAATLHGAWAFVAGVVAVLALYRAGSFIHEITHIKLAALPGFRLGWNLLVGIPLMVPSFMYEGIHNQHHAKTRYGTIDDPEYLPLALMKPWSLPVFVIVAALAPVALLFRFAVLAPLSLLIPALRREVVEKYSGLVINPQFRRRAPEGAFRNHWLWLEAATSAWAIGLLAAVAMGFVPLSGFLTYLGVISGATVINQVRTLVAHLWENEGEAMSVTAQYLDTVNVPPPAMLPMLWAPVGLRYHALHHLLPGVPYHALGEAHRRITAALDAQSVYHKASYPGLPGLVARLAASTMGIRR